MIPKCQCKQTPSYPLTEVFTNHISITYLKIHNNLCIKLKFYINKPSLKTSTSTLFESIIQSNITKNHQALIRLEKFKNRVYISNDQIDEILQIFKDEFKGLLFVKPLELMKKRKNDDVVQMEFNKQGYKIRIHVSVKDVEEMRRGIVIGDSNQLLIRRPKENGNDVLGDETVILQEDDDDQVIPIDDAIQEAKFIQKYSYKTTKIMFNKTIRIEVLKVPMGIVQK